jgi:hypothetical protein
MSIRSLASIARRSSASSALAMAFGIALVLAGGVAHAAATNTLDQASLAISINPLPPITTNQLPPGSITASVSRGTDNSLTGVAFPDLILSTVGFVLPVTDPAAAPIKGVQATIANGAADFHANGGNFGGNMPLVGQNKVCLFGPCTNAVANIAVPVNVVGIGGVTTVAAAVNLTVVGAPWTDMTAQIGTITHMGSLGPNTTTPMGDIRNSVSLVTPIFVSTNIAPSAVVPVFGIFSFRITTPEPTTIAALGASIVALTSVGMKRRKR